MVDVEVGGVASYSYDSRYDINENTECGGDQWDWTPVRGEGGR